MIEFFKGWRRKTGVLTLLLACVVMAGWVRSKSRPEVASALISSNAQVFITSDDGNFECGWFLAHYPKYFSTQPTLRWMQYDPDQHFILERREKLTLYWSFFDLGVAGHYSGTTKYSGGVTQYNFPLIVVLPYWSIVFPLTLISLWLLLSKRRKSTPQKITDPIPAEGF